MKKILFKSFMVLSVFFLICIIGVSVEGYKMFKAALENKSLAKAVTEIRSTEDFTPIDELPKTYLNAIIAAEDHRFDTHFGVDPISIARATLHNIMAHSLIEGGSTITQQLAKNMFFSQEKSFVRKVAEALMAIKLENEYSKDEILELYVNSIYFGNGCYNVKDACNSYFHKEPSEMTDYECTLLAGIPNAPSVYALTENPELAVKRQKYVVKQMIKYGYISEEKGETITSAASAQACFA